MIYIQANSNQKQDGLVCIISWLLTRRPDNFKSHRLSFFEFIDQRWYVFQSLWSQSSSHFSLKYSVYQIDITAEHVGDRRVVSLSTNFVNNATKKSCYIIKLCVLLSFQHTWKPNFVAESIVIINTSWVIQDTFQFESAWFNVRWDQKCF